MKEYKDITKRKQTEDALHRSAEQYSIITNTSMDGFAIVDSSSRIVDVNEAYIRMIGYTREELLSMSVYDIEVKQKPAEINEKQKEAIIGPQLFETRHRRKDGSIIDIEVSMTHMPQTNNLFVFLRDITQRKMAEEALRESEEHYLNLIRQIRVGITVHAPDLTIQFANEEASRMLGLSIEQMQGKAVIDPMWRFVREDGSTMPVDEYPVSRVLATMQPIPEYVVGVDRPVTGDRAWGLVRAYPEIGTRHELKYIVVSFVDITERIRAEEELLREKQFSEKLLESLPGIFFLYDPTCHLKRWNKAHETAMGFTADELRDWYIPDWHETPEDAERGMALVKSVLETGVGGAFETTLINKQGTFVPYLISITRLAMPDGPFMMGVGIDLTERIELEEKIRSLNLDLEKKVHERTEELRRAYESIVSTNRELEAALKNLHDTQHQLVQSEKLAALGQLAAGMAHELNTPLGAITSSNHSINDMIRRGLPMLADRITKWDKSGVECFNGILAVSLAGTVSLEHNPNREFKKEIMGHLEEAGISECRALADAIADLGVFEYVKRNPALLKHRDFGEIIDTVTFISSVRNLGEIVSIATDKATHVVGALRSYLRQDEPGDIALVDIKAELDMILTLYHNKLKFGITVTRSYDSAGFVLGNRNKLNQVWMNLINNALQAMDFKGTLDVSAENRGEWTLISVADSGPGIPEEIRDHIFEPFFTTKRYGEGIGLGLDICSKIVEALGGRIEYTSVPGHTVFRVWLKAAERPA